jgi:hypothetical protein
MKSRPLVVLLLILSICVGTSAQTKNKVDDAGVQFWNKFKTAVASNDKEAVASMTRLPFMFQGRELEKTSFIQKFDAIFSARIKRCFAKATLVR